MNGFWSIAKKELLHLQRDPATLVIALLIPLIQMTLFGYAIDFDVRHIPTVVADLDHSRESRQYLQKLSATQYIQIERQVGSPQEASDALREGRARAAVIIPSDFSRKVLARERPSVGVLIDGSDSTVATRARSAFIQPLAGDGSNIEPRFNILFNPTMRTELFMIPGLIGVILQLVTVSLTAFSLVREREQGTMEQLMVSPVGRIGLMLGKLAPYSLLALFEMALVLVAGWLLFDVRVVGSIALLILLSIPFLFSTLALGLLISTLAQNQAQALQLSMLIMLPSILMSGFAFPRETQPGALYLLSNLFPVTHFLNILRGIIVRGADFWDVWQSVGALILIAFVLVTISTMRFRKSVA